MGKDNLIKPGVQVKKELDELDINANMLAKKWNVSREYVDDLFAGKMSISEGIAVQLQIATGVEMMHWLKIQEEYNAASKL